MEPQEEVNQLALPCRYLRSKEMYYQADEENDYGGVYWCMKTHEGFGPDHGPVSKADCCNGRSCYLS